MIAAPLHARRRLLFGAALAALLARCGADPFDPAAELYERPHMIAVPHTMRAPTIDGRVGPGEWEHAAALTGLLSYDTGDLVTDGPVAFICHDATALYLLCLTPVDPVRGIAATETRRDGRVYGDDAVEVFVQPPDGGVRQVLLNPLGTVADLKDDALSWDGEFPAAAGECGPTELPAEWGLRAGGYWVAEIALPYSALGSAPPADGDVWRFNLAADRSGPWCALAGRPGGRFSDPAHFAELRFLPPLAPYAGVTGLGNVSAGEARLAGLLHNPTARPVTFDAALDLRLAGSTVTRDAYRNVIGAIVSGRDSFTVPPGGSQAFALPLTTTDTTIDRFALHISARTEDGQAQDLLLRSGAVRIEPPVVVKVGTVPSHRSILVEVDPSALARRLERESLPLEVALRTAEGKQVLVQGSVWHSGAPQQATLSYEGLPPGDYRCLVTALPGEPGEVATETSTAIPATPEWLSSDLYDGYAAQDRVLLPWTPVEVRGRELAVWGRSMRWEPGSILPAGITSRGVELLAEPMALVVRLAGVDHPVPLDNLWVTERKQSRVTLVATGRVAGIVARVNMWLEYDGFLWMTVRLRDSAPGRRVDAVRVQTRLPREQATLYQTFSREHAGWIERERIALPWLPRAKESIANFYHWLGNEDRGLGFTYTGLEHWAPASEAAFCTIEPAESTVTYYTNLIERPCALTGSPWLFGLQATPIKPLPPDYHAMLTTSYSWEDWHAWRRIPDNVDTLIIWPPGIMPGLNAPYNVDDEKLRRATEECHSYGIPALFTACPQKVSAQSEDFEAYRLEWQVLPESVLNWDGVLQVQNCGRSYSLRKWLFYGWAVQIAQRFGMEGVYYDGWQAGQIACSNPHHGCGWVDDEGRRHVTVPVLEGREFNQRLCMFLEDHVRSPRTRPGTAPERPGFPGYQYRIHSWEFVPSVMGFATQWLTGEFSGYPLSGTGTLEPDGTFGTSMGLGLYRSRCLSTNWGVPNLFHVLVWEHTKNHPTNRQTLMAYAWFLPHGTPPGEVKYMNQETVVQISDILTRNAARRANFTPGWRENRFLKTVSPIDRDVMVATWDHNPERRVLAVVSNLKVGTAQTVRLRWTADWAPRIRDAMTGEPVDMDEGGEIVVEIPAESFVLWEVESG